MASAIQQRLASCSRIKELLDHHARERSTRLALQSDSVSVSYEELHGLNDSPPI